MPDNDYYRGQIARELLQLSEILVRYRIVNDVGPLYAAAAGCKSYTQDSCWAYNVERLLFRNLGDFSKLPSNIEDIYIELSVSAKGVCELEEGSDPLISLTIDIKLIGSILLPCADDDCGIKNVTSAWHLDRHIAVENDITPKFAHPHYHFQFGGKNMKSLLVDDEPLPYGAVFIADTPRIAHPPMEAILGIDFVLTNFMDSNSLSFRFEDGEYINLIQAKQVQIWKPHVHSLYQAWENVRADYPWQPDTIWPQLFPERY